MYNNFAYYNTKRWKNNTNFDNNNYNIMRYIIDNNIIVITSE